VPGTIIRERTQKLARSLSTDTGVLYLAGQSDRGRQGVAEFCRNMAEVEQKIGQRSSNSLAWDMADGFFGEGGSKLYFSRVLGVAPVRASKNLLSAAAVSLRAVAKSPGTYGNTISVGVVAGDAAGEFKIRVTAPAGFRGANTPAVDETSPSFVDQASAIQWSTSYDIIDLDLTGSATANDPDVVAPGVLAGGTDDAGTVSDATAAAALLAFDKGFGPGQVAYVNRIGAVPWTQLRDHCIANNRRALYDLPDTTVKATLLSNIATLKALGANVQYGAAFGPWVELPALVPGGSGRPIPASAVVAGVIGRNDGRGVSPNKPAGGDLGILQYASKLRGNPAWTEQDYTDLNEASVNMLRLRPNGDFKIFGYRSAVNKASDPVGWQFGNQRLYMAIAAKADNILERYVLREIDGRGLIFKELQGELQAMLNPYFVAGSLYGHDPDEAYFVDVDTVNTPQTIANGEIHAAIELTMSPMGETVILDIVKKQIV
jgi:hypothetical protein